MLLASCAPGPQGRDLPDPRALETLRQVLAAAAQVQPFRAVGRGRFTSQEGTLEGDLTVRSDPPDRAWIEFRTGALFGLVAERVVIGLPGDHHVLVYRAREDVLDRFRFDESAGARLGLWGGVATLQALARGCIPWPGGVPPQDLESRTRSAGGKGIYAIALEPETGPGELLLEVADGRLRRLTWRAQGKVVVDVRYDRYAVVAGVDRPMRVRLRAPTAAVEAEVEWQRLEVPARFEPSDFEVGARNPRRGRGVEGG